MFQICTIFWNTKFKQCRTNSTTPHVWLPLVPVQLLSCSPSTTTMKKWVLFILFKLIFSLSYQTSYSGVAGRFAAEALLGSCQKWNQSPRKMSISHVSIARYGRYVVSHVKVARVSGPEICETFVMCEMLDMSASPEGHESALAFWCWNPVHNL